MKKDFKALYLDKISRHFLDAGKEFPALSELSVTIEKGEFITLLGPSGCGKSTALNCIVGLFPLSGGQILLDDVRIDQLPSEKRGFGMVFQNYALFPHMTVADNVGFGLMMRKLPKSEIREKVSEALQLVRLVDQENKLPDQLSGGQQQRVAIARAIVIEPLLILMDEPLSNLDAKLRLEMRSEIKGIHRKLGRSTIYVTHDQDEALSLADRIVVIDRGKTQQIGLPQEVFSAPANIVVARYMGYRTVLEMNVVSNNGERAVLCGRGLSLSAKVMQPIKGNKAYVAVRPDDFRVGEVNGNVIDSLIKNVDYCGTSFQVDLLTGEGDTIHMRTNELVEENIRIKIGVSPERALAYPVEDKQ